MSLARVIPLRFIANGMVATAVHFAVLYLALQVWQLPGAGLSNLLASLVAILVSFLGNRHFVFASTQEHWARQLLRFGGLYLGIALFHGMGMFVWSDWLGWDFRTGFVLMALAQAALGYLTAARLVFQRPEDLPSTQLQHP